MSILEALRKLITKRGGTPKGSNIAEMISNYANEDTPSPAGGGTFIVNSEWTEIDSWTKGFKSIIPVSEFAEAYKQGKNVLFIGEGYDNYGAPEFTFSLLGYYKYGEHAGTASGQDYVVFNDGDSPYTISITEDGYVFARIYID